MRQQQMSARKNTGELPMSAGAFCCRKRTPPRS
jgi:hypothetical protein